MLDIEELPGTRDALKSAIGIHKATLRAIEKSYFVIGRQLVKIFNRQVLDKSQKTGNIYIRKDRLGRRRRHQASAEGESPANRTGNYRKSVGFKVQGDKQLIFGNAATYAGFLEIGTKRMKPRPGLGNAVTEAHRDILREFTSEISAQI